MQPAFGYADYKLINVVRLLNARGKMIVKQDYCRPNIQSVICLLQHGEYKKDKPSSYINHKR